MRMVRFLFLAFGVAVGTHWAWATPPVEVVPARYCFAKDRIIVTWPWTGVMPRITRHVMTAIDRTTGEIAWHVDGEHPPDGAMFVVDDVVFVNLMSPKGVEATALDANKGKRLWAATQPMVNPSHSIFVLPLQHAVLTGTGQALEASTGRVLWDLATQVAFNNASYDSIANEIAVCRRTAIPKEGFELTVYDATDGKSLRSSAVGFGSYAYIRLEKGMVRGTIEGSSGTQYISVDTHSGKLEQSQTRPSIEEHGLSAELQKVLPWGESAHSVWSGEGKRVFVLGGSGTLYCLGTERAVLLWKQAMEIASPQHEWPLLVSDHPKMVVVGYAGRHVRRLKPETGEIISETDLPEKP